jgi:hypothetical protein
MPHPSWRYRALCRLLPGSSPLAISAAAHDGTIGSQSCCSVLLCRTRFRSLCCLLTRDNGLQVSLLDGQQLRDGGPGSCTRASAGCDNALLPCFVPTRMDGWMGGFRFVNWRNDFESVLLYCTVLSTQTNAESSGYCSLLQRSPLPLPPGHRYTNQHAVIQHPTSAPDDHNGILLVFPSPGALPSRILALFCLRPALPSSIPTMTSLTFFFALPVSTKHHQHSTRSRASQDS